jgi:hypothetical protein
MLKLLKLLEVAESPETAGEFISELMTTYKPVVYSIIGEFFGVYRDFNNNDDYFAEVAKSKQKALNAYIAAGFTRDEALLFLLDSDLKKDRALNILRMIQVPVPAGNE